MGRSVGVCISEEPPIAPSIDPIRRSCVRSPHGAFHVRRVVVAVVVVILVLVAAGLIITYIQKARMNAYRATTQNNLRQLSLFAAHHANADPKKDDPTKVPKEIPAGTVVLAGVPPENRLSWFVYVLPDLDQKRQDVVGLITQINQGGPWRRCAKPGGGANAAAGCALSARYAGRGGRSPARTCYVGIAGVGPDAATLVLPPPPGRAPRAGAFRYDAATPFDRIGDGLSQTLLLGETANDLGPWLRGGPSTVAEWMMERRKAAHSRGRTIRRLLPEWRLLLDVRWIGEEHHTASVARRVTRSGND